MTTAVSFTAVLATGPKGRVYLPVPFDPDEQWGAKPEHHICGTVGCGCPKLRRGRSGCFSVFVDESVASG